MSEIILRAEAVKRGLKRYFNGKPCPKGHIAERTTQKSTCVICTKLSTVGRPYKKRDPAIKKESDRLYRKRHPERYRDQKRRYEAAHKQEARASRRKWRQANRDKVNARRREILSDPVRRAHDNELKYKYERKNKVKRRELEHKRRAAEGRYTEQEITDLLAKQQFKCPCCRASLRKSYHVDHVIPIKLGGTNWISNIQLLCRQCNQLKSATDPIVWAQRNGMLL